MLKRHGANFAALVLIAIAALNFGCVNENTTSNTTATPADGLDRTILPIAEPKRETYKELDARNAEPRRVPSARPSDRGGPREWKFDVAARLRLAGSVGDSEPIDLEPAAASVRTRSSPTLRLHKVDQGLDGRRRRPDPMFRAETSNRRAP